MITAWRLTACPGSGHCRNDLRAGRDAELLRIAHQRHSGRAGLVIPGATVVLTNTATNERREGLTGEDRTYRGDAPRVDPDLRGHYMHNWNFAVTKATALHGRVNLTLRAEAFNLFNRTQFGMPNTQVTTAAQSNLGRVATQSNQPRLLQLAFRLTF